jgi:hypothetical protein
VRDGTVAIGGPNRGPGEPAAELADFIEQARALSAKYRAERVRRQAQAEVMPVTRNMLAAAVGGDLAGLAALVSSVREETYQRSLTVCVATAVYVAADVSRRPPGGRDAWEAERRDAWEAERRDAREAERRDAREAERRDAREAERRDAREAERRDAERENAIRRSEAVARAYGAETALGTRPAGATILDAATAARLTIVLTGRMVFRFRPAGSAWWQYLDRAWEASVAEQVLGLWCPRSLGSALCRRYGRARRYITCGLTGLPSGTLGCSKRAASVIPMRRITACDGVLSTEVKDQTSGRPTPVKATSSAARAASVAYPWCHAVLASRQPISVPSGSPGTFSGIGASPVNPMNSPVCLTSSAHSP